MLILNIWSLAQSVTRGTSPTVDDADHNLISALRVHLVILKRKFVRQIVAVMYAKSSKLLHNMFLFLFAELHAFTRFVVWN